jgi:tetratricopeptide (TPR) repeat protein
MPKTILILAANPKNTTPLSLQKEVEGIEQQLNRLPRDKQFILKTQWATTTDDIRRAMLDHQPQYVHFAGHGAGEQGIVLEDSTGNIKLVSTEAIANFFEPFARKVECVIFNACHSALQASAIVRHIENVIGMNQPISDKAAIKFAVSFYEALAAGEEIESAFKMGRSAIELGNLKEAHKPTLKKRHLWDKQFWNVPLPPNPFFTGREKLLRQLHETLNLRQAAALSGLGGVGKTQTATHYAYLHRHEYQAVLWVLAETVESIHAGLVAIARVLDLPEKDAPKQQTITAVKHWLETHNDWLLILDNADDVKIISELNFQGRGDLGVCQENFGENSHILFTTRAAITEPFAPVVTIDKMSDKEGTQFLIRRALDTDGDNLSDKSDDHMAARFIAKVLDGLPLAISQAGAYIQHTQCGLVGYLQRYRSHALQLLAKRGIQASIYDHPEPVITTWALSFEKIANENPLATEILYQCAFLHPDKIPEEIFQNIDPVELDDALAAIFKYSLLHREPKTKILSIHRLVQMVLKHEMAETKQRTWVEKAVRAVNSVFPEPEFENWAKCERLLPCAQTCAELIDEWELAFEESARLLNQTAYYLNEKADYEQAKPLYERALAIWEKVYGIVHPLVATSLNNLAGVYKAQGAYEQAKSLLERALAIREKVFGKEHFSVATSLNNLAGVYKTQGAYEQAKPLLERALAIRENVYGKEHPSVATSLNNLALLYNAKGAYEQALPLYQRALAIREKVYGKEHPSVATSLNNLALLYDAQGAYEQAKPLYQRVLAIYEKVYSKDHPSVATSLNNLASVYQAQSAYGPALPLYQRALVIREKLLGKEHPDVAQSLNNLAMLYQTQGAYEQAKPLYERALKIFKQVFKSDHPHVRIVSENYAFLLEKIKKTKKIPSYRTLSRLQHWFSQLLFRAKPSRFPKPSRFLI